LEEFRDWFRRQDMPDVRIESLADIKLHCPDVCFTHGRTLRSDCPIDAGSSFGVRILGEKVDRNPAAKSKSSLLFFGAVERKLNLLSQATEITELF
jgi:hypothetical protein